MYTLISMMNKAMIILNKYITKAYAACMYVCMYVHTYKFAYSRNINSYHQNNYTNQQI